MLEIMTETMLTDTQIQVLGDHIVEVLHTIYDPEIPIDIYELGLIYDVQVSDEGVAKIVMTLTTPNCPVAESMPADVETKIAGIEGISSCELELTFEPQWTKEMMSEEAMLALGFL
jgi:FeS assembly SUF system protein